MKTKILLLIAIITMSFATNAQIDRSKMPTPGPDPVIKLGEAKKFSLDNGLTVIMVENHKLPRVSATLEIDNKPYFEGEIAGVSDMMGSLLGRGTTNISKDDFNEKVDYLGANVGFFSSGASARSLKKYFPEVLGLMADGIKNSQFTQEEFDKEKKVTLESLKATEKNIPAIASRVERLLVYGKKHPNGQFTSKESINKITLQNVKDNFNTYYRPNNAYLVIVGDINPNETKELVKKLFSDWKKGVIPVSSFPKPENVSTTEIDFVNMPTAKQSEVSIVNSIDLTLGDKDYYAALLANKILGGGGSARLFNNLREDKAYTYGSYSSISQSRQTGVFKAYASVRNMVTDSSIVEIQKEINKIRYQKVSEKELQDAKEEYIGNFVMNVQKPETAANFELKIALYNLPEDFYANYIKNINSVTVDDVQNAAIKYFRGDKARIVVTGKGIDVLKNLEKTDYVIKYFDKEGNPTTKPAMTLPIPDGMTAETVINKYLEAIGGKDKVMDVKTTMMVANATIQGTPLVMKIKALSPNKSSQEISVMGNVMQKTVFNGTTGFSESRGQKTPMTPEQIAEAKSGNAIFSDLAYTTGKLVRIEPIDGKNAIVLKYNDTDIYYDMTSGLKVKEVKTVKTPDGKEIETPTVYSDYKAVNGIMFPHSIGIQNGPMSFDFKVKEIKINEGVSEADFK
ncbi:M16 family metallopeptidase [Polaribacter cellanae]|uniref:Insulinase family protein n=1 Tax=Polaribacter cellanae TaxID=2818493 RepID=A0A975CR23_9FLAO|nr:pitrilysin family protein [Polaribacter cellanae]QTE24128.1 insulinase family protein [Polaribacter cellanae]